jgi:hypothetical protein
MGRDSSIINKNGPGPFGIAVKKVQKAGFGGVGFNV